jgi:hypothetical protein
MEGRVCEEGLAMDESFGELNLECSFIITLNARANLKGNCYLEN